MGKAIAKTIVFLILILATCVLINWVLIPNNPKAYQAAKLDKIEILKRTPSPKIILVGGSNLAFSMDSKLLSEKFGFPVVNMGLAKSVGLGYMLEEVKPYINEDDIVILAPEYELFFELYYGSDGLLVELQYYPEGLANLKSWGAWETVISKFAPIMQLKFAGYLRKGTVGLEDSVYARSGFNQYGDIVTHLDAAPSFKEHQMLPDNVPFHTESIDLLNDFNEFALRRGARVLLTWPPLVEQEFERHKEQIWELDQALRKGLAFPIISKPEDYIFPLQDMYDSAYHLRREGRSIRTQKLINDLDATQGIGRGGSGQPT